MVETDTLNPFDIMLGVVVFYPNNKFPRDGLLHSAIYKLRKKYSFFFNQFIWEAGLDYPYSNEINTAVKIMNISGILLPYWPDSLNYHLIFDKSESDKKNLLEDSIIPKEYLKDLEQISKELYKIIMVGEVVE